MISKTYGCKSVVKLVSINGNFRMKRFEVVRKLIRQSECRIEYSESMACINISIYAKYICYQRCKVLANRTTVIVMLISLKSNLHMRRTKNLFLKYSNYTG
ncbi:hypothetical protein RF11_08405 [Thelohanellus kitauei]|uniref:Uncharacterized protein n=1 Tax=Thelohanellus kitauei TaxID=669202 RepID=A0A0C2IUF4_THEKT|nr:hypothetical protein RF11_08405 [Thelohanellus kitauei]